MSDLGFLHDGHAEHKRAHRQHLADLKQRLATCQPEDRAAIERELEETRNALRDADDHRILW